MHTHGYRKGVVYQEFYCVINGQSMVQKRNLYCPVNTKWLSRVEFREYILQVIKGYYPNYLVVSELPEELEDHIIYFVETLHEGDDIYYDIYVYDHEIRKQIKINCVSPGDLLPILQFIDTVKNNSLKNIYNTTLTADRLIYSDDNGYVAASDIVKSQAKEVVTSVRGKCLGIIYNQTLNKNKLLMSNSQGNVYTSAIDSNTAATVVTGMTSGCLKDNYSNLLPTEKVVITNASGTIEASDINKNTAATVVTGVSTKSLKNVYNTTLTADRIVYTDSSGYLAASDLAKSTTKTVVDAVTTKFLSSTYNTNLTANKILGSNGSGKLYATGIDTTTANNVITGISTKSFKNVYNTTITANKLLCTDGTGIVTTTNKYTVASPLEMYSNKIELSQVFDTAGGLGYWKIGIDVYGRVSARQAIDVVQILGYIRTDRGSVNINTPSNNCALFFLNTHAGNFYLAQICINTNSGYRRVFEVLKTSSAYNLPTVTRNSDTNVTITATGNCRAVIFTFNTAVT